MKLDSKTESLHFLGILLVLSGVFLAVDFNFLLFGLFLVVAGMSLQWHLVMYAIKDLKTMKK